MAQTVSAFFPLPALGLDHSRHDVPSLPVISPRFSLPLLDEHASGEERIMAGLRGLSRYQVLHEDQMRQEEVGVLGVQNKGKGRAIEVEEEREDGLLDEDEDGRYAFWIRAGGKGEAGPSRPRIFKPLKTWDTVKDDPMRMAASSPFLTEQPLFSFDALITANTIDVSLPHLASRPSSAPLELKAVLQLMLRATLGTTTVGGIVWSRKDNRFSWDGDGARPVGIERITAASASEDFLRIATCLTRLEMTVDSLSPKPMTPTHHALLHVISTYLTYIKDRLTDAIEQSTQEDAARWLKWVKELRDIRELCMTLCEVIDWPVGQAKPQPMASQASVLLTKLHAHFLASLSTSSPTQRHGSAVLALAYLLSRSSAPLLHLLQQWIGLADSSSIDEDTDADSQPWSDLGITRLAIPDGSDGVRWEYSFSSRRMPGFIPRSDRHTLFEAGKSLRLLREATGGGHPLCFGEWGLKGDWGWDENGIQRSLDSHVRRVRREVQGWRRSARERSNALSSTISLSRLRGSHRKQRGVLPVEFTASPPGSPLVTDNAHETDEEDQSSHQTYDPLWDLVLQQPGTHLESKDEALWGPTPISELKNFINRYSHPECPLLPPSTPILSQFISSHLLAPLLAHAKLVSTSLVRLYLDDLNFVDHLDVLRSFWLGGDVSFLERVNGALFGKDVAGAGEALGQGRRARTRARLGLVADAEANVGALKLDAAAGEGPDQREWGIGLGLGLSERSKWPPGGSELAYALRTTLLEEASRYGDKGEVWEGIEDRVSFALRDLPEDAGDGRRARWLDPQAIEALDFLYLSYSPPNAITHLLPRQLMGKYQTIQNFLLRLGRVETVLRSMYFDIVHQCPFSNEVKRGVDDHQSRLASRPSRLGIAPPSGGLFTSNTAAEQSLHLLRFRMTNFITALTRYVLDTAIGTNFAVMQRRLNRLRREYVRESKFRMSRPGTPTTDGGSERFGLDADDLDVEIWSDDEDDEGKGSEEGEGTFANEGLSQINQLQSIHSLVLYHHIILDRILRSCLLSSGQGHQIAYKVLMKLFGLILDLGKVVKQVERGSVSEDEGVRRVGEMRIEWEEKEKVFLHAIDRLSQRSTSGHQDREGENEGGNGDDLDFLLHEDGEAVEEEGVGYGHSHTHGRSRGRAGADLQELLVRLRIGMGAENPRRRWEV